jgi:UrcA family protein
MSRTLASLFAAVAIAAASITPATAETVGRNVSVEVSYADLDLTRMQDVKTLTFRIRKAIDAACGRPHDTASQTLARKIRSCRTSAFDKAVASINAPLLTELYEGGEGMRFAGL